jgi:hypothetical protein
MSCPSSPFPPSQRVLSITGLCIAAAGLIASCFLQNVKLTDEVTLDVVEKNEAGKIEEKQ